MQNILGHIRRADNDFGLIGNGDKIAVGLSGGKDSLTLVAGLKQYQRIKQFEIVAITIDCTNGKTDFSGIADFCKSLGVEHVVEPSNIFEIIFDIRKEKSPCSLCSKLRRGILNSSAKSLGCNKVALGHHSDDMLETFFLSLFYEGRLSTLKAKSYLDRMDLTVIRPLIYAKESEIIATSKKFPILDNCCAVNGKTQRQSMKNLVKRFETEIPNSRERMQKAIVCLTKTNNSCDN